MAEALHRIIEWKRERAEALAQCRTLSDQAAAESRDLTKDEQQTWDRHWTAAGALQERIQREERLVAAENAMVHTEPEDPPPGARAEPPDVAAEYQRLWSQFCGPAKLRAERAQARMLDMVEAEHEEPRSRRSLMVSDDPSAGYLVPYQEWTSELLAEMDLEVQIRRLAREAGAIRQVRTAKSYGAAKRTKRGKTFQWGKEISRAKTGIDAEFGTRALFPNPLSGAVEISRDFLSSGLLPPEQLVRSDIAVEAGEIQEYAYCFGDGPGQPLGMFVPSDEGVPLSRDVVCGDHQGATFEGMVDAKYGMRHRYWNQAVFLTSQEFLKTVAKVRDENGQPLWRQSLRVGEPDTLMGRPLALSEVVPNTLAADQYVGMFYVPRYYWIVEAMDVEIQRLDEMGAMEHMVIFVARLKVDGMPMLEEAFVRMKLGPNP